MFSSRSRSHPRAAMQILRHAQTTVTMEVYSEVPSAKTRGGWALRHGTGGKDAVIVTRLDTRQQGLSIPGTHGHKATRLRTQVACNKRNPAHLGSTVMTVCPIWILSPFFSH